MLTPSLKMYDMKDIDEQSQSRDLNLRKKRVPISQHTPCSTLMNKFTNQLNNSIRLKSLGCLATEPSRISSTTTVAPGAHL